MTPSFRFTPPPLWRPPYTVGTLQDVDIQELPPGTIDPSQYGKEDIIEFLNRTQKLIADLQVISDNKSTPGAELLATNYLLSRLQLESGILLAKFGTKFPDYVILLNTSQHNKYAVHSKAIVAGFYRRGL